PKNEGSMSTAILCLCFVVASSGCDEKKFLFDRAAKTVREPDSKGEFFRAVVLLVKTKEGRTVLFEAVETYRKIDKKAGTRYTQMLSFMTQSPDVAKEAPERVVEDFVFFLDKYGRDDPKRIAFYA